MNGDILFDRRLIETLDAVVHGVKGGGEKVLSERFLVVGRRSDLPIGGGRDRMHDTSTDSAFKSVLEELKAASQEGGKQDSEWEHAFEYYYSK